MNLLRPFYFELLTHPWILTLVAGVAVLFVAEVLARPSGALSVSTGETLARIRGRSRTILRRLPALLRAIGLILLIVALARPLNGMRLRSERADVVDILLAVDISGSMTAEDFIVDGHRRDRLFVTKLAVRDFIDTRKARPDDRYGLDRVGLILYGSYAWMQCPLTLDYGVFEHELDRVVIDKNEDKSRRTAIGSALGLSVSKLNKSEALSRVIILLTDGINNHGNLDPITAAQVAADYGIRVYTIGAGSPEGGLVTQQTLLGPMTVGRSDPIDEDMLKRIAEISGGKYYRATDLETLQGAYQEINELEATEIDIEDVYDYDEGFVPYAIAGTVAMLGSIFSRRRWFEAIP